VVGVDTSRIRTAGIIGAWVCVVAWEGGPFAEAIGTSVILCAGVEILAWGSSRREGRGALTGRRVTRVLKTGSVSSGITGYESNGVHDAYEIQAFQGSVAEVLIFESNAICICRALAEGALTYTEAAFTDIGR